MWKNVDIVLNSFLHYGNVVHYSAGQPYCSVKFLSLRTGDEVHNIPYTEPVTDIRANDRYDLLIASLKVTSGIVVIVIVCVDLCIILNNHRYHLFV